MRLDAVISRWRRNGAETVDFPPVMNRSYLERNGYLKSFPQLATALHGFTCNNHGQVTGEDLPTELMLVPAACYPIYPMVAERWSSAGRRRAVRRLLVVFSTRAFKGCSAAAKLPHA